MKVLILAAGYGSRLARDLKNDTTGKFDELVGVPKPLLPIGKIPLISRWMKDLAHINAVDKFYVVTNALYHQKFETWAKDWPQVQFVCDGTNSNETRIGAVAAIALAVKHFEIKDDLMVIGGDTLFSDDFSIQEVVQNFDKIKKNDPAASMVLRKTCADADVHKYGILEIDDSGKVIGFLEKPKLEETSARNECPCFYIFSPDALQLVSSFLEEKKNDPFVQWDATGNFVKYLYSRKPVFTMQISGRYDVGGLGSYIQCNDDFSKSDTS